MLPKFILQYLRRLKFPWLFAVTAALFGIDLVVPDVIPFADELLLGAMTLLLGAWRTRKAEAHEGATARVSNESTAPEDGQQQPTNPAVGSSEE